MALADSARGLAQTPPTTRSMVLSGVWYRGPYRQVDVPAAVGHHHVRPRQLRSHLAQTAHGLEGRRVDDIDGKALGRVDHLHQDLIAARGPGIAGVGRLLRLAVDEDRPNLRTLG